MVPLSRRLAYPAELICLATAAVLLLAYSLLPSGAAAPLVLLAGVLRRARTGRPFERTPLDIPLALFVLSGFIGLLVAADSFHAWLRFTGILASVIVYYLVALNARGKVGSFLVLTFVSGSLVAGTFVVLALVQGHVGYHPVLPQVQEALSWFEQFPHPTMEVTESNTRFILGYNGIADMGVLAITLAVAVAWHSRKIALGAGALAYATPFAVLLLTTNARGAVLAMFLGLAVAVGFGSWRLVALLVASLPLALGAIASGVLGKGLALDSFYGGIQQPSPRFVIWQNILYLMGDYGLTGAGLGIKNGMAAYAAYFADTLPYQGMLPYRVPYAHSIYFETYLEQGPLGLVSILAVLGGALWLAWGGCRSVPPGVTRVSLFGATGGLVTLAIHGLTDQVASSNIGTTLLFLLAGTIVAATSSSPVPVTRPAIQTPLRRWPWPVVAACLGSVAVVGLGAAPVVGGTLLRNLASVQLSLAQAPGLSPEVKAHRLARGQRLAEWSLRVGGPDVRSYLTLARFQLAQYDAAGVLDTLAHVSTSDRQSLVQVGALYHRLGMDLEAAAAWSQARASDRLAQLGQKLVLDGDGETAEAVYRALWESDPAMAESYCRFGVAWVEGTDDLEKAIRFLGSDDGGGRFRPMYRAVAALCAAGGQKEAAELWDRRYQQTGG